jgi:hypothetical protein
MGYYSDGETVKPSFDPNNAMTRAEVGVMLSRLLRGNTYAGTEEMRYQNHLQALQKYQIMHSISSPLMLEIRKNVMVLLFRIGI